MRLRQPRIDPIQDCELDDEQRETLAHLMARGPLQNFYRTFAHAPDALKRFLVWGSYVLSSCNQLPGRERQIAILRTGFLCKSGYAFAQHRRRALQEGLSIEEIAAVKTGAGAATWGASERTLILAVDQLHASQFIGDPVWEGLGAYFSERQRMDIVFTVGQYVLVSMMLNTFGVQFDPDDEADPDIEAY